MDMRFGNASVALAVIVLLSYQMAPCSADLVHLSIEEMTEAADIILIGTVEEVLHFEASSYTIPQMHRQITVSVERYLKNPLETNTVTVVDLAIEALLVPEFQESERVLLFLSDEPTFLDDNPLGYYQVLGLSQGKFTVDSDGAVNVLGEVIEDDFKVGEIKFKLSARPALRGLVFPGVVALFSLGVLVFLYNRSRVST